MNFDTVQVAIGFAISFLTIAISVLWFLWSSKVKRYSHIPTAKYNLPIFGNLFRIPSKTQKMMEFQRKTYDELKSKTRVVWVLSRAITTTKDVRYVEDILKSSEYISKGKIYELLKEWIGEGLLISDGDKWKTRRRLLTPAFHFDILKSNFNIMAHHAEEFVRYLKENKTEDAIEVFSVTKYFSLNVICETAMGVQYKISETLGSTTEQAKYVDAVDNLLHMLTSRVMKPWFHSRFFYRYFSKDGKRFYQYLDIAKAYVQGVIEKRIKDLENVDKIESNIFLDILISSYKKGEVDIEGIIEEVNTFMFEGHDTVSSAISWTMYLLGRHEEIQEKLFDEINNQDVTLDSLSQFRYLESVIKESLRVHPPVPGVSRLLKNETVLGNDLKIPGNSVFGLHFLHMQRDESYWKDPLTFYPERFMEESERNPFSFVPFSAGPRNCIGQRFAMLELKIVMLHLVKNFRFLSMQAENEVEEHSDIIHRSVNGLWVKIIPRIE